MTTRTRNSMLGWAAGALFYWWLMGKTQPQQLAAGAVVSLIAAAIVGRLARYAKLSFHIQWRWLGLFLARLPGEVLRDLCVVAAVLGRALVSDIHPTGSFQVRKFSPGQKGKEAGRRALVFAAISLPPNSFAISLERGDSILTHQLTAERHGPTEEWQS